MVGHLSAEAPDEVAMMTGLDLPSGGCWEIAADLQRSAPQLRRSLCASFARKIEIVSTLRIRLPASLAHGVAAHLDAVRVVHEPVEDAVGERGKASGVSSRELCCVLPGDRYSLGPYRNHRGRTMMRDAVARFGRVIRYGPNECVPVRACRATF